MTKQFTPIIVGPYWTNILDLIGKPLCTRSGHQVEVKRDRMDFVIYLNDEELARSDDNLAASSVLNKLEVGVLS